MNIKLLTQEDWLLWKHLRLEAVRTAPEAFYSSFEEESTWPDEEFQSNLKHNNVLGAFVEENLIACLGFYHFDLLKTHHKGVIWGMYVKPEYRGQGIAEQLLQTMMTEVKSQVTQLQLCVTTTNQTAITLYQKYGFKIYGTEPHALKMNDQFYDTHLMVLIFTAGH